MRCGDERGGGRLVRNAMLGVVLAVGLALIFWGDIRNARSQAVFDDQIAFVSEVRDEMRGGSSANRDVSAAASAFESARSQFEEYNAAVAEGDMAINDPFSDHALDSELLALGVADSLVGSISVPAMDCNLPLYFGSTDENLARGAAVISGTSLPLGEASSNCVIAAHRGWNSAAFFCDIEDVSPGDSLVLSTPWGEYRYVAVASAVISPSDLDAVRVFSGLDMVTLVTCHPYGRNTERYIVYFEREGEHLFSTEGVSLEGDALLLPCSRGSSLLLHLERFAKGAVLIAVAGIALWAALGRGKRT